MTLPRTLELLRVTGVMGLANTSMDFASFPTSERLPIIEKDRIRSVNELSEIFVESFKDCSN